MKILWVAPLILAAAVPAAAQEGHAPAVTVSAAGKVEKTATALQFTFQLSAKGETIAKAVEALQEKQKGAAEKLKGLGVAEKDVIVTPPAVEKKQTDQRAQMMRMMRSGNRLKKKKDDEKLEKDPVVVSVSILARLPLQGKDATALFLQSEQLKEKVKASKLVEKEKKEEGAEAEEEDEAAFMQQMQNQEQQGLDEGFLFQFWAPSDPKDVETATSQAMASAKTLAESAARAVGKTLGAPTGVEVSDSANPAMQTMQEYYFYQYQRRAPRAPAGGAPGIVAASLDGLEATVMLKVTFGLK